MWLALILYLAVTPLALVIQPACKLVSTAISCTLGIATSKLTRVYTPTVKTKIWKTEE